MIQYIKNQWKHALLSFAVAFTLGAIHYAIEQIDPNAIISLWWWFIIVWGMATAMYEKNQSAGRDGYWADKRLDSLLDWISGMAGFVLGLLLWWVVL
jgi:hypothetical protein